MPLSARQQEMLAFSDAPGESTCLSVGTVRSGKTWSASLAFGLFTQRLEEAHTHFILGRKLRVIENEILPVMEMVAELCGQKAHYRRSDSMLWVGDQKYHLVAGVDERSSERLQGFTIHSAMIDEATLVPESFLEMALSRMTFADSKMWLTCNPSYPLHYLKRKWIDGGRVDQHLQFTFEDNPTLAEETKQRFRDQFTGVFKKRYIDGLWYAGEGLVFPEWKTAAAPEADDIRRTDIGIDYGPASTTALVALHSLKNGTHHVPAARGFLGGPDMKNKTDAALADATTQFALEMAASSVVVDPSAVSFRGALLHHPDRNFNIRSANNAVLPGVRKTGNVLSCGRVTLDEGPRTQPLMDELASYVWDPKKPDTPLKENDHYCDALRYVVMDQVHEVMENVILPEGF